MQELSIKDRKRTSTKVFVIVLLVFLMVTFAVSAFFFYKYSKTKIELSSIKNNPQALIQQDNTNIIEKVSELIKVPEGESPTVVTVYNLEQLKDQPFFANAKEGDKVLIYSQAKKAILYDPVNNIIVEVAPLVLDQSTQATGAAQPTQYVTPTRRPSSTPTASPTPTGKGGEPVSEVGEEEQGNFDL